MQSRSQDGVAVLALNRPVANALAPSLRRDLKEAVERAVADPETCAIVLTGAGNGFSSGVDITEYDRKLDDPWVADLCLLIEDCTKPVVAALHGLSMGAGFELALAAHARVARTDTRVALPEIGLGLVPGAGGTQRLPRLVGAKAALGLLLTGRVVDAADPGLKRAFDRITDGDPVKEAVDLARSLAEKGTWLRTGDCLDGFDEPKDYQQTIESLKRKLTTGTSVALDMVNCVEAAQLLPFHSGLAFEQVIFRDRLRSPESRGLRHVFAAERRAGIMPELARGRAAEIAEVAILDGGVPEADMVAAILNAGKNVSLSGADTDRTGRLVAHVHLLFDKAIARNRMSAQARNACLARLSTATGAAGLDKADLVVDTGKTAAAKLRGTASGAAWILLNGDVDLTARSDELGRERGIVGCRFYKPVNKRLLCELTVAQEGLADTVASVDGFCKQLGLTVVRAAPVSGGPGRALVTALYRAALWLVEVGLEPVEVDNAARRLGFAAGAFRMIDNDGLQTVRDSINRHSRSRNVPGLPAGNLLDRMIEDGATGRSAGRGFYTYHNDSIEPTHGLRGDDPDVSTSLGGVRPEEALHAAIVNEAAYLLAANVVQRASDLDVLMVRGYGFDNSRGGPLFYADLTGVYTVLKNLHLLRAHSDSIWGPHPMIEDMVKNGDGFFGRVG